MLRYNPWFAGSSDIVRAQYTINPPKRKPTYPFGFGLSYTTFAYSEATLNGDQVTVSVTNTGSRSGQEVVQLYVTDSKASVVRPKKELKGFCKVALQPCETKLVYLIDSSIILKKYFA